MEYGHYDDKAREFVITRPDTPSPWINYLGSEAFFTLMSNTSGGYSFYKDARLLRVTRYRYNNVPMDDGGQYFYVKDGDTVWNPGWRPVKTPLDEYECRHGMGYTSITGKKNGLVCSETALVPVGVDALVTRVVLRNESAENDPVDQHQKEREPRRQRQGSDQLQPVFLLGSLFPETSEEVIHFAAFVPAVIAAFHIGGHKHKTGVRRCIHRESNQCEIETPAPDFILKAGHRHRGDLAFYSDFSQGCNDNIRGLFTDIVVRFLVIIKAQMQISQISVGVHTVQNAVLI